MEAASGILRHIHELGRSSPLRWVLDRIAEGQDRATRAPAAAANERWQDVFWEHAPRNRTPRMQPQSAAALQAELFGWLAPDASARPRAEPAAVEETRSGVESPRSRSAALAKPAPVASVRKLRMSAAPACYADRRRTVNHEAVARLLEVTRGVLGVRRAPEFSLPRGRFAAQVEMWKGRPVGTPFVMERRAR